MSAKKTRELTFLSGVRIYSICVCFCVFVSVCVCVHDDKQMRGKQGAHILISTSVSTFLVITSNQGQPHSCVNTSQPSEKPNDIPILIETLQEYELHFSIVDFLSSQSNEKEV